MPIYEYVCHDCAYKFELKQSMKDEAVATCEKCGRHVSRIISPPAIMFKGSGWYVTDYSDKLKPPTGESSGSSSGEKKDAAASPATPAPSPAPATTATSTTSSTSGSGASSSGSPSSAT